MNKIIYTSALVVFLFTSALSQGIDDVLPDKIGTGTHSTVVKSTASLLAMALRSGAAPDVLRYKNVVSVEYHNGTSWVNYVTTDWKHVLDGVDGNAWSIPYNQVRFTIDLGGEWIRPSAFLLGQDWQNGERSYDLTVESSNNQSSWSVRLAATSTGSSHPALNIFMVDYQMEVDRYVRLTIQSLADATNPLNLRQVSAFTKRFVGLASNSTLPFYADFDRNIGIGTTNVDDGYKLSVGGKIRAEEVKVETGWADYVFDDGYALLSLQEVENYIDEHGHLPNIPSAEEVAADGIELGAMNAKLLEKIEELTLYTIQQETRINELEEAQNLTPNAQNLKPNAESLERKLEELTVYLIELKKGQDLLIKENQQLKSQIDQLNNRIK